MKVTQSAVHRLELARNDRSGPRRARRRGPARGHRHRLTRKRGYKRAVIAIAHKLLRCIFALLRDGTPYRHPATDYEALLVQRNASRWLRKLQEFDILVQNDDGTLSLRWPSRQDRTVPVH